jgi:hypothetical protein
VVAVGGQLDHELGILGVAFDEAIARMAVEAAADRSVLAEVVDADDLVAGLQQLADEVAADKPGGAGDEDLQSRIGPVMPQMSTTSRPLSSSCL